jgi:hypothetical protein
MSERNRKASIPRGYTLIKHQPVGGEILIPNNMPRSVLEFSGIAWVCAGIMTLVLRLRITLSALPLRMDMLSVGINVCLVPKADMPVGLQCWKCPSTCPQ